MENKGDRTKMFSYNLHIAYRFISQTSEVKYLAIHFLQCDKESKLTQMMLKAVQLTKVENLRSAKRQTNMIL